MFISGELLKSPSKELLDIDCAGMPEMSCWGGKTGNGGTAGMGGMGGLDGAANCWGGL